MQLIEPGLDLYDTMNNRRLGAEHVAEKFFGIAPTQLGDVLALMGDSVDNVPGVPGVGPKTAAKLILEHGDLESVLAAAEGMKKGKLRDNLIEHAGMARLSRELVSLRCDVALPEPLEDLELKGIPDAPLRAFLEHHGFRTLLAKLGQVADAPVAAPVAVPYEADPPCEHDAYETVVDVETLDRWIVRGAASGLGGDRYRDDRHRCDPRRSGRRQPRARRQQGLLHPARPWRQRPVRRDAAADRSGRGARPAQDPLRGRLGAQDRAQSQVRHDRARPARHRRRAA